MPRWFRRKDKDKKKSRKEKEAPLEEEIALEREDDSELPEPEQEQAPEREPTSAPGEASTDEIFPASELRRGFFRRWRQREAPEAEVSSSPEEATPEETEGESTPESVTKTHPPLEEEFPPEILKAPEVEAMVEPLAPLGEKSAPETPENLGDEVGVEPAIEARRGMFRRLRQRLSRTREALSAGLDRIIAGRTVIDADLLEDLEELLITADLGVDTSLFLIDGLREKLKRRELGDVHRLKAALKAEMISLLTGFAPKERGAGLRVALMVGVNGVGKTTTIAKLAHQDRLQNLVPMLVAADTFRAAAVEQLEIWGQRVGATVVKQKTGADPAAVVFDGLGAALARGVDTVYIDTAGRLHTKVNLMEELKKIHRTAAKKLPGAPHEVLLVLDATTGQNALNQARLFHEAVGVTGIILTKMDGTAKGGVALAVAHETGIPIRYIGVGEAMEDLRPFDPEVFVEAILG